MAVEALRNTSLVHLASGEVLADSRPLKQWEASLPPADYLRVHRGSIVQLDAVRALDRSVTGQWRLHLATGDGRVWNVGRQMLGVVRQHLEGVGTVTIDRAPRRPRTTTQP
ncbi:MAG: LytTR family transcriptional regulator [Proteobacteria bacterium]|nr:LytTR family transcriptional regulator [Pseudomonadota bacterium]